MRKADAFKYYALYVYLISCRFEDKRLGVLL